MGADQFYELINGENRFRILTSMMDEKHFAVGYEIWERYHDGLGSTGKPKRFQIFFGERPEVPQGAKDVVQQNHDRYKKHSGGRPMDERELSWNNTPMYFWALCVWSYEDNAVKVWMPTQSSILNKIKNLALLKRKNAKGELIPVWGSPTTFDLTIVKTVYGDSTEYMVNPNPQSDMPKNALELLKEADITMSNIFEGRYPMANTPKLAEEVAQGNSYSFQQNSPFTPADEDTPYHQNPPKKNVEKHKPARPANLDKAKKDEQLLLYMVDNFKRKCSDFANREDESGFEVEELQKLYTDIDDLAKTIDPQTMVQLIESANYVLGMYDMESIGARKK